MQRKLVDFSYLWWTWHGALTKAEQFVDKNLNEIALYSFAAIPWLITIDLSRKNICKERVMTLSPRIWFIWSTEARKWCCSQTSKAYLCTQHHWYVIILCSYWSISTNEKILRSLCSGPLKIRMDMWPEIHHIRKSMIGKLGKSLRVPSLFGEGSGGVNIGNRLKVVTSNLFDQIGIDHNEHCVNIPENYKIVDIN